MDWRSLPSVPRKPSIDVGKLQSFAKNPTAVLAGISLLSKFLTGLNPARAFYAILDARTMLPLALDASVGELTVRVADYDVPDYPIEDGGFRAYNKVRRPTTVDLTLVKSGTDLGRAAWLESIRQRLRSDTLATYNIVTPQGIFTDLTIVKLDYQSRQDKGSRMLYLNVQFSEIPRIDTSSLESDTPVDPESSGIEDSGRVFSHETDEATASRVEAQNG